MTSHEPIQGFVPVPNELFDTVLPQLTDTELRVLLVVIRQTVGFREGSDNGGVRAKRRDWISHSQLIRKTGRASEAVSRAIAGLVQSGFIIAEDGTGVALRTAAERRRHIGRIYYRPGDKWITSLSYRPAKPKTTTNKLYNKRLRVGLKSELRVTQGWQRSID